MVIIYNLNLSVIANGSRRFERKGMTAKQAIRAVCGQAGLMQLKNIADDEGDCLR